MWRILLATAYVGLLVGPRFDAQTTPPAPLVAVIPRPASLTVGSGTFTLAASTVIVTDPSLAHLGHQLSEMLAPATGFDLEVRTGSGPKTNAITLRQEAALLATL